MKLTRRKFLTTAVAAAVAAPAMAKAIGFTSGEAIEKPAEVDCGHNMTATEVRERHAEVGRAFAEKVDRLIIEGLDADYNYQKEIVTGPVSDKAWSRVFRVSTNNSINSHPINFRLPEA